MKPVFLKQQRQIAKDLAKFLGKYSQITKILEIAGFLPTLLNKKNSHRFYFKDRWVTNKWKIFFYTNKKYFVYFDN